MGLIGKKYGLLSRETLKGIGFSFGCRSDGYYTIDLDLKLTVVDILTIGSSSESTDYFLECTFVSLLDWVVYYGPTAIKN